MQKVIEQQESAENIIFCGDGQDDIELIMKKYPKKKFYCVSGNCDFYSKFEKNLYFELAGRKFFITHGDMYYVKSGYDKIVKAAKGKELDIVVFGHTHKEDKFYINGTHFLNPGSCWGHNSTFATIDIDENNGSVLTNIMLCNKNML